MTESFSYANRCRPTKVLVSSKRLSECLVFLWNDADELRETRKKNKRAAKRDVTWKSSTCLVVCLLSDIS